MNSYQKDTITQLTPQGVKNIIDRKVKSIICQVLEIEKYPKKDLNASEKYKYTSINTVNN